MSQHVKYIPDDGTTSRRHISCVPTPHQSTVHIEDYTGASLVLFYSCGVTMIKRLLSTFVAFVLSILSTVFHVLCNLRQHL